jgi:hypothetical protein
MTKEIPEIDTVHADTGMGGDSSGMSPSFPGEEDAEESEDDEGPQAPF